MKNCRSRGRFQPFPNVSRVVTWPQMMRPRPSRPAQVALSPDCCPTQPVLPAGNCGQTPREPPAQSLNAFVRPARQRMPGNIRLCRTDEASLLDLRCRFQQSAVTIRERGPHFLNRWVELLTPTRKRNQRYYRRVRQREGTTPQYFESRCQPAAPGLLSVAAGWMPHFVTRLRVALSHDASGRSNRTRT